MSVDIQPVILEFLSRRKSVGIPGLGRLFWSVHTPQRGTTSAEMISSRVHLLFEPGDTSSTDLLQYITQRFGISELRAERWLVNWGTQARKKIEDQGKLYLKAIGTFVKDEKKGISFSMDASVLDDRMHLPDLALTPVDRAFEEESAIPVATAVEGKEEEKERGFLWVLMNFIIPLLLILAIAALSFFIYQQLTTDSAPEGPGPVADETIQQEPQVIVGDTTTLETDDTTENEAPAEVSNPAKSEEEVNELPEDDAPASVSDPGPAEDTTKWIEEEVPVGQEEQTLDSFENRFCIIIVGSFVKPGNAQKMINKVEEMGLTVHTEPYGRFTRVGVKFDCYETDLYRRLFQLRGTFTEDAWILKYREDGQ